MKRALVVTPNWPPLSHPDLHRVRMALPYFAEFGWEPLILKVDPDEQEGIRDPMLCVTVPDRTRTWQAAAIPRAWTAWFGLNSVGIRCLVSMARLGSRIIREEKPDMVFISTTLFPAMLLGRYWKFRHGIPYALDFQDPWRQERGQVARVPKTGLKRRLAMLMAALLEPIALRGVSHIVSVSAQYPVALANRYPWLQPAHFSVLPFGAAEGDFAMLSKLGVRQKIFTPRDGRQHWVYVGRGGADMALAARGFFKALSVARAAWPERYDNVTVHFIGTDYAPAERSRKTIEPLAIECGVGDLVEEIATRIPYFEALSCLKDADALIVLGSEDGGYSASKIYPYILAAKPMLAIFHEDSSIVDLVRITNSGTAVSFKEAHGSEALAAKIGTQWFGPDGAPSVQTNWDAFEPYTARKMTGRLCSVFDAVVARG